MSLSEPGWTQTYDNCGSPVWPFPVLTQITGPCHHSGLPSLVAHVLSLDFVAIFVSTVVITIAYSECNIARFGDSGLSFQHSKSKGQRIVSLRSTWAISHGRKWGGEDYILNL